MDNEKALSGLVEFFHLVEKLKQEKRKGWVQRGVKEPESVADHSFRLALLALVFAERQKLDVNRCVLMALLHDLPEILVGDVATMPGDEDNAGLQREKHRREEKAMKEIAGKLDGESGEQMMQLWQEFEKRESKEAVLVYELDRLEAIFQAQEYAGRQQLKARLQVFFDYGNSRLRNEEMRKVFEVLLRQMKEAK